MIFRDDLEKWIEKDFDYVGAPWAIKDSFGNVNLYVGNGPNFSQKNQVVFR